MHAFTTKSTNHLPGKYSKSLPAIQQTTRVLFKLDYPSLLRAFSSLLASPVKPESIHRSYRIPHTNQQAVLYLNARRRVELCLCKVRVWWSGFWFVLVLFLAINEVVIGLIWSVVSYWKGGDKSERLLTPFDPVWGHYLVLNLVCVPCYQVWKIL